MIPARLPRLVLLAAAALAAATAPHNRAGAFAPSPSLPPAVAGAARARARPPRMAEGDRGCAATPLDKKRVAVFGAGGSLGATVFGFLQRAGSLYGTGILTTPSTPRALTSTVRGALALNRALAAGFKLAQASEDAVRFVDPTDPARLAARLEGVDACVLGTTYRLERWRGGPKTPRGDDAARHEFYLRGPRGAPDDDDDDVPDDDDGVHADVFRASVRACRDAGVSHVVVVETHRTADPLACVGMLEEGGVPYTYLRTGAALGRDVFYTFEKGVANALRAEEVTVVSRRTLPPFDADAAAAGGTPVMMQEDLAAAAVQCLLTLDWGWSRIIQLSPVPGADVSSGYGDKRRRGQRFDREWCPNSEMLAKSLARIK